MHPNAYPNASIRMSFLVSFLMSLLLLNSKLAQGAARMPLSRSIGGCPDGDTHNVSNVLVHPSSFCLAYACVLPRGSCSRRRSPRLPKDCLQEWKQKRSQNKKELKIKCLKGFCSFHVFLVLFLFLYSKSITCIHLARRGAGVQPTQTGLARTVVCLFCFTSWYVGVRICCLCDFESWINISDLFGDFGVSTNVITLLTSEVSIASLLQARAR